MQDIEFTVQKSKLWILQTRSGKRTSAAAVKIAVDMFDEKLISKEDAILRVEPLGLDQLLHPTLDPNANKNIISNGNLNLENSMTSALKLSEQVDVSQMAEEESHASLTLRPF